MLGRALKRVVSRSSKGNSIEDDFDETGVDIVEALNLVNIVTEDDASKDFNEKEISISNIEYKADKTTIDMVENSKIVKESTISKPATLKKTFSFDSKFKQKLRQNKARTIQIKPVFKEAIRRGKMKAFLQFENLKLSGLPILPKQNKITKSNTDKEIFDEYKVNGTSMCSLNDYLTHDNEGRTKSATFSVKFYEMFEKHWKPSKIKCDINQKEMIITMRPKKLLKFNICQIDFVKIENGKRVVWIRSSKNSVNLLGILLESCLDCDNFMMLLDLCWKQRNKSVNLFMAGNMNLDLPEKPILFSSIVKWTKSSCMVLEFLGRYLYHLQTPRKEIKSLEASNFYIKAGFIYIYELDSENLPFFTLALAEADIKVNIGDPPSILISKEDEDSETTSYKLLIFTRGSLEATRIERIIAFSDSCKNFDDTPRSLEECYRIGICNDHLVWQLLKNEIFLPQENQDADMQMKENVQKDVSSCREKESWRIKFRNIVHVALDLSRCHMQISWSGSDHLPGDDDDTDEDIETDLDVGGSAVFSSQSIMLQFLNTLQSCSNITTFNVNSRQKYTLA